MVGDLEGSKAVVGEGEEGSIAKIGHHNEKHRGKFPTVTISQKTLNIHTHTRNSTSPNHYIYYHANVGACV